MADAFYATLAKFRKQLEEAPSSLDKLGITTKERGDAVLGLLIEAYENELAQAKRAMKPILRLAAKVDHGVLNVSTSPADTFFRHMARILEFYSAIRRERAFRARKRRKAKLAAAAKRQLST